jgi:hypothetical protein
MNRHREPKYSYRHFKLGHSTEVRGQLYVPVALITGNQSWYWMGSTSVATVFTPATLMFRELDWGFRWAGLMCSASWPEEFRELDWGVQRVGLRSSASFTEEFWAGLRCPMSWSEVFDESEWGVWWAGLKCSASCTEVFHELDWRIQWSGLRCSMSWTEMFDELDWDIPRTGLRISARWTEVSHELDWRVPRARPRCSASWTEEFCELAWGIRWAGQRCFMSWTEVFRELDWRVPWPGQSCSTSWTGEFREVHWGVFDELGWGVSPMISCEVGAFQVWKEPNKYIEFCHIYSIFAVSHSSSVRASSQCGKTHFPPLLLFSLRMMAWQCKWSTPWHGTQNLSRHSLLSKYRMATRYTCTCNLI